MSQCLWQEQSKHAIRMENALTDGLSKKIILYNLKVIGLLVSKLRR